MKMNLSVSDDLIGVVIEIFLLFVIVVKEDYDL
jgi:hypothetical protein